MAKTDFIPRSDADFLLWHDHFLAAAIANQAELGLSDAELAAHKADNADFHAKLAAKNQADSIARQATAEKNDSRARAVADVRASARRIKAGDGYSEALGLALGIEGPEDSTDLSSAKPALTATDQTGGVVVVDFDKSKSDGVNLYCKREGDADFLLWHDRFLAALFTNQAKLGLTDAELAAHKADNADFHAKLAAKNQTDATAKQATAEKTESRARAMADVRALARRIKAGDGYAEALGLALGIEGPEDSTDLSSAKPALTATDQTGGVVEVDFVKSRSDGINLYCKREGDADFVFLARDTVPPYVDNRPLLDPARPEIRRYTAVYVLNDEETGLYSDEAAVTCSP